MKYRYLKISGDFVWGIDNLTKERFVNAVKNGELIIDLETMTVFDRDKNSWVPIDGDDLTEAEQ